MERIARSYLQQGNAAAAASILSTLELKEPRWAKLAKSCRVLADPQKVPIPHRFSDIVDAVLDDSLPMEAFLGPLTSTDETLKCYNRLIVLVHPDKNPSLRASDAFVRLKAMKDAALQAVDEKRKRMDEEAREAEQYERLHSTPSPVTPPSANLHKPANGTHPPKNAPSTVNPRQRPPSTGGVGISNKGKNSRPPSGAPQPPNSQAPIVTPRREFQTVLSSLQQQKSKSLKLSCNFQMPPTQSAGCDAQSDDDDDETLNCTVRSTVSNLDGTLPSLSGSRGGLSSSSTLSFVIKRKASQQGSDAAARKSDDQVIENEVLHQSLKSAFATNALATTQSIWEEYRKRTVGGGGDCRDGNTTPDIVKRQ